MPPQTKKLEGTPHSRRIAYLQDQLRAHVTVLEIPKFANYALSVARENGMRMPKNEKDFPRVIRRMHEGESGANGWSLDLVEAALLTWDRKPVKLSEANEQNGNGAELPPAGINFDPTVPPKKPEIPADISFLVDAVTKLNGMTDNERRAALNYLHLRYDAEA